jgi:hypothetical protein
MQRKNTCQIVAGRLMEIDVAAGYQAVGDIDQMIRVMGEHFARVPEPTRIVIAADWRACRVLTPDVSARAVQMLARSNPRVERSAILHSVHQATSVLQVLRLTREAQLPYRRVFTDPQELKAWLAEILQPPELARLDTLLWKRDTASANAPPRPSAG